MIHCGWRACSSEHDTPDEFYWNHRNNWLASNGNQRVLAYGLWDKDVPVLDHQVQLLVLDRDGDLVVDDNGNPAGGVIANIAQRLDDLNCLTSDFYEITVETNILKTQKVNTYTHSSNNSKDKILWVGHEH